MHRDCPEHPCRMKASSSSIVDVTSASIGQTDNLGYKIQMPAPTSYYEHFENMMRR
jgi:hypothetical protein